jgi:NADPH2:quinone reductase
VLPAQALVPKPAALSWPQAAGLMITGVTGWHALTVTGVSEADTLTRMAQGGSLRVFVSQTFPLADAAGAHRASQAGHTTGKIALIS